MRIANGFAVFLLAMGVAGGRAQESTAVQPRDEALQLLDRVARHYQDAEALHLEAMIRSTSHQELYDSTQTAFVSAYAAQGGRFRYDGRDYMGSGMIVSDGTTEWRLMRGFAEYGKAPAGTFFNTRVMVQADNSSIFHARDLLNGLNRLGTGIRSAHMGEPETLKINGREVLCTVVGYGDADYTRRSASPGSTYGTTLWIDPVSLTVVKEETVSHSRARSGAQVEPFGPMFSSIVTTEYSVTDLNFEPKSDTFSFTAPRGSQEVAKFSGETTVPNAGNKLPAGPAPAERAEADHLNRPLPSIMLNDAAGNPVYFSKYLGHPLLIDVWATWCAPCMEDIPAMNKIRQSTEKTDLQMVGVDEDTHAEDAVAFLKRKGYNWEDLHYNRDMVRQLSIIGVPLTVLVDSSGNVVYFHVGAGHAKELSEAIAKLGPQYASVRIE